MTYTIRDGVLYLIEEDDILEFDLKQGWIKPKE